MSSVFRSPAATARLEEHALRKREGFDAPLAFASWMAEEELRQPRRVCSMLRRADCGVPAPPPSNTRCQNAGDDNPAGAPLFVDRAAARRTSPSALGGRTNGAAVDVPLDEAAPREGRPAA